MKLLKGIQKKITLQTKKIIKKMINKCKPKPSPVLRDKKNLNQQKCCKNIKIHKNFFFSIIILPAIAFMLFNIPLLFKSFFPYFFFLF